MLNVLIGWSARNSFLVLRVTLFVTLAGIYAVQRPSIDALPNL